MDNFRDWITKKKLRSESQHPADRFQFNRDGDVAGDYEKDLQDLTKVVMSRYQTEFTRWLAQLADENGDSELEDLIKRVQTDGSMNGDSWEPTNPKEKEEIVAPKADRGSGNLDSN